MAKRNYHKNRHLDASPPEGSGQDRNGVGDNGAKGAWRGDGIRRSWLFGTHAVLAAIENPARTCVRLLTTPDSKAEAEAALYRAGKAGLNRPGATVVDRGALNRCLPAGAVHQGLALEVEPLADAFMEDICHTLKNISPALVVAIDQGTDPRNIGAVMRSAAAFGASAVIVQDRHTPHATGHMAKAASGALETVPLVRVTNLGRALEQLKGAGFWCVGLDNGADDDTTQLDWPARTALVLGSEGAGMRRLIRENCDFLVRIPMTGRMDSLNLSNAAAIALYEAYRKFATG